MDTWGRISNLMRERGVKASELSSATGINPSTFSQWKRGLQKPSVKAVKKIANYFNVTTDSLLGLSSTQDYSDSSIQISAIDEAFQLYVVTENLSEESQDDLKEFINYLKIRDKIKRNEELSDEISLKG